MEIYDFSQTNSILNQFLYEIREKDVQRDRLKFRRNIERIGEILTYEMSKSLSFEPKSFATPLSSSKYNQLSDDIVVCSILRAGIPLHNRLRNYFDSADSAFVSAYRKQIDTSDSEQEFQVVVDYLSSPSLEGKTLILADPMCLLHNLFIL